MLTSSSSLFFENKIIIENNPLSHSSYRCKFGFKPVMMRIITCGSKAKKRIAKFRTSKYFSKTSKRSYQIRNRITFLKHSNGNWEARRGGGRGIFIRIFLIASKLGRTCRICLLINVGKHEFLSILAEACRRG